jgi:hypothetical protein
VAGPQPRFDSQPHARFMANGLMLTNDLSYSHCHSYLTTGRRIGITRRSRTLTTSSPLTNSLIH